MNMNELPNNTEGGIVEDKKLRFNSIEEAKAFLAKDMSEWDGTSDLVRKEFLEVRMSAVRLEIGALKILQDRAQAEAAKKISEADAFADMGGSDVARIDRDRKYNVGTSPQA